VPRLRFFRCRRWSKLSCSGRLFQGALVGGTKRIATRKTAIPTWSSVVSHVVAYFFEVLEGISGTSSPTPLPVSLCFCRSLLESVRLTSRFQSSFLFFASNRSTTACPPYTVFRRGRGFADSPPPNRLPPASAEPVIKSIRSADRSSLQRHESKHLRLIPPSSQPLPPARHHGVLEAILENGSLVFTCSHE